MSAYPVSSNLQIDGTVPVPGKIELSDGTNAVTLEAPNPITASYDVALPPTSGTLGQFLTLTSATASAWANFTLSVPSYTTNMWILSDQKPTGTDGGGVLALSWTTRDLNTINFVAGTPTDVQLAVAPAGANQILIQAGVYKVYATLPFYSVTSGNRHRARLVNVTDGVDLLVGGSITNGEAQTTNSVIEGIITIPSQKVLILRTYSRDRGGFITNLGIASGTGSAPEIYTRIIFTKV